MQRNSVICKVVAKECRELKRDGCTPTLERLSSRVYRLGQVAEVREAFDQWIAASGSARRTG